MRALLAVLLILVVTQVIAMADLIDHAAPVPLAENRGVVATTDRDGRNVVILQHGYLGARVGADH